MAHHPCPGVGHLAWAPSVGPCSQEALLESAGGKDEKREACMGILKAFGFQSPPSGHAAPILKDFQ